MEKATRYFVQYFSPGLMVSESWETEIKSPNPNEVEWPKNAYCFKIFQREDVIDGTTTYTGERKQIGPTYYHPGCKVETLEEVKKNPNATRVLISNMEYNGWEQVVWTQWGSWPQPYDPEKATILPC